MALPLLAALLPTLASGRLVPRSSLPLRTSGRQILDADGQALRLACVNWYGAHLQAMVLTGLDVRPVADIAATTVELGFNCVRLPFSLDMIYDFDRIPDQKLLTANPALQNLSALAVFDAAVSAISDAGLLVILNNHVSSSGWCCGFRDEEGLWYTEKYPEKLWLEGLERMAERYRHDVRFVGMDLRNEIRPSKSLVPSWGSGEPATDWSLAAEQAAQRLRSRDEKLLIMVSGLFYGMFLCDVSQKPLHLLPGMANHTVYTVHEYGATDVHLQAADIFVHNIPIVILAHVPFLVLLFLIGGASAVPPLRLELPALLLTLASAGAAAWHFARLLPACGFARQLPLLLTIIMAALLELASLWLWAGLAVASLCKCRQQPSLATPICGARSTRPRRWRLFLAAVCTLAMLPSWVVVIKGGSDYEAFAGELEARWAFVDAPVWLGEFGAKKPWGWWELMTRYLREHPDLGWSYWSLNGDPAHPHMAVLAQDSLTVQEMWRLRDLQDVM